MPENWGRGTRSIRVRGEREELKDTKLTDDGDNCRKLDDGAFRFSANAEPGCFADYSRSQVNTRRAVPVNNCVKAEKLRARLRRGRNVRKQSLAKIRRNAGNNRRYIDIMPRDLSTFCGFSTGVYACTFQTNTCFQYYASSGIIIDTCYLENWN